MKKLVFTFIAITLPLILVLPIWAEQSQSGWLNLDRLILPNFVYGGCYRFKPAPTVVIWLDERFVNTQGSELAPTSCKGGDLCWSWKIIDPQRDDFFADQEIFSSTLPLRITNTEKLSKSVAQTIKQSQSLRKSAGDMIKAAQEFIDANFGTGKERGMTKEKAITQSKTLEQAIELNVTPLFHLFLSKALQGNQYTIYPLCHAAAVDLFMKMYKTDRVSDLVHAFVIYKTIKPEDIDFSSGNDQLNKAKFLYSLIGVHSKAQADFAWAQAVLFSELLNWEELKDVKQYVESEIQKVYQKYNLMANKTTSELVPVDKTLAAAKYTLDKQITSQTEQSAIKDKYLKGALWSVLTEETLNNVRMNETKQSMI